MAAFALCVFAAPAAATVKWSTNTSGCGASGLVNTCTASTATSGTPGLSLRAYSNTATAGQIADAYVGLYGSNGIGVTSEAGPNSAATAYNAAGQQESTTSPNHAMDNNGNYETLLLQFSGAVTLTELQLGWYSTDSDISVLAYTGSGLPSITGRTYSNLTSYGWSVVGNYANVYNLTTNGHGHSVAVNTGATPLSSSYWLVGAYNSVFGTGSSLGTGNDYVKLVAAYGAVPRYQTPEPASALLLGIGLIAAVAARRARAARGR